MKKLKAAMFHPAAIFIWKTLFYLMILLGLLWFYGFKNPNDTTFIYNEF
ncbi:teichoic acid D-Ala incorporation-associated protein DltX [Listeria booriae]|nr:teichoic acid D-Ala incorporation-associated protein DltX [Listeria booriae]MBC1551179.1 teichoic acid D-Ala incorporation-associated protein DltX [Listeria booriae]